MKIIAEEKLSEKHLQDINKLYEICNQSDGTQYCFSEDLDFHKKGDINTFLLYEDNQLLSVFHIFAPTVIEAEITALTLPQVRRKGYFKILFKLSMEELQKRGTKTLLYICDVNSKEGKETLTYMGAKYEFSEFAMEHHQVMSLPLKEHIQLEKANERDKLRYIEINQDAFSTDSDRTASIITEFFASEKRELYGIKYDTNLIGMIGVMEDVSQFYIHGFCIEKKYQKQGIGQYVLSEIVNICKTKNQNKAIELDVETNNEKALKVYTNIGFNVKTEFRYYREELVIE